MNHLFSRLIAALVLCQLALIPAPAEAKSQCETTPWKSSHGKRCSDLGLDSNRAICRDGDEFAMYCDSTSSKIRTCASTTRCKAATPTRDEVECPKSIRDERKSKRACNGYRDGYAYGVEDARKGHASDYQRWDDKYTDKTEEYFRSGYNRGYRDTE